MNPETDKKVEPMPYLELAEKYLALEAELEATQYGLAMTQHYWINPMEYEEDRAKWSKREEALEARLSKMEEDIQPIIDADYTGQGSAQDYDAVIEAIQEELAEALAGGSNESSD